MTRQPESFRRSRGVELANEDALPADLDEAIWKPTPTLDTGQSLTLLAACREGGAAHEVGSRGLFTQALLEALRGVSTRTITHADLVRRMANIPG